MEIQKVFSNIEEPEETLYSVLMSEDEIALFSELQKEFNSKSMKALRNAWESAAGKKAGIPEYVSKNYRTVVNPDFKRKARQIAKESVNREVSPVMEQLNRQGRMKHPDYSKIGKLKKKQI